jgi:hypothetical protein
METDLTTIGSESDLEFIIAVALVEIKWNKPNKIT